MYSTDKKAVLMASAQELTGSYVVSTNKAYLEVYAEDVVRFDVIYTTGAAEAGTSCSYKIETSNDNGATWFQQSLKSASSGVVSSTDLVHTFGGGAGGTDYLDSTVVQNTAQRVRISVLESGSPSNPGSVTINAIIFAGVGVSPDVAASASGGGGGGGAVTIADGDDAALGAKANAAASSDTGTFSLIALFKRLLQGMTTLNAKDFATQTTLAALNTKVTAVNTGAVTVSSSALPTGAATEATLSTLNGKVTACNTGAVTVSSSALPTGAATETTLATRLTESDFDTKTGSLTETAPATDTASSGLNGRLQRIAQRVTSLITLLTPPTFDGAQGVDATGQDTYATIKTTGKNCTVFRYSLGGSNDVIISLDGGVTDHFTLQAGTMGDFPVSISSGVNIQAKNRQAGLNYSNLYIATLG